MKQEKCSKGYLIRHIQEPDMFWSNDCGWVHKKDASRYSERESDIYAPPYGGEWVEIPPKDLRYYIKQVIRSKNE